ncbi:phosphotransferase enzyme family protein [Aspergillus sclerotioniger CBS 115572]|uniref:Phosphotransferase enzyme family protein n=1 Tax=Aspergillus sclerotioniger CBS 115572 TaxID=1450535 RepID=A0A317XGC1_9EURO|nr:phosphotransferase enzyme family protein [Aspergillus sclerotioniger CBS 115572]PWY96298.1 phosphotransferase enzyme family protein [Aspergillus sclerotioniger CBS 115572]
MKMYHDEVAGDRCDEILEEFKKKVSTPDTLWAVTEFMKSHRPNTKATDRTRSAGLGAFNLCFRMEFEDGFASMLRFPCPGLVAFPEEKVRNEVAVMTYLKKHTKIPVPSVISYGMKDQSPGGLGPFILMEYIANASDRPFLDPNIEESKLEFFYGQVADILLELSKPSFKRIGSVAIGTWDIDSRPLTMNMNELVQLGNFPPIMLPQTSFSTASSYYKSLAQTEFLHLQTQRNDAIDSKEDCHSKYITKKPICNLTEDSRLVDTSNDTGPFKLFCDDFQFTYVAPREYTFSPPWWLLLEMPEEWPQGIMDWKEKYQPRLETFLRVLKDREDVAIASGDLEEDQRLSEKMWESWISGDFWVHYGLRKSWAFDAVWPMMDARLFGGDTSLENCEKLLCTERLDILSAEDKKAMEPFAQGKLKQMKLPRLDTWDKI